MKKTLYAILLVSAAVLLSCKKTSPAPSQAAQQKIQAKWHYVSSVINNYSGGMPHLVTLSGNAADYVDFRNDGKVYSLTMGTYDTSAYAMLSSSKLWIGTPQDEFEIKTLTESSCILYNKEIISAAEYTETTVTLNK